MRRIASLVLMFALSSTLITVAFAVDVTKDGKSVDVPVCGGFIGLLCKSNQWCDFPVGYACGAGDHFGLCKPRPEICTNMYRPVCGCDGKTYSNDCKAHAAGASVYYSGPCREDKPDLRAK